MNFKEIFTNNIALKSLALLASLLLWFFVTMKGLSETILELPVEYKKAPKGYEIKSTSTNFVQVKIKGHESLIKSLSPKDVSIFLDLSEKSGEERIYYIDKNNFKMPFSLTVTKIVPPYVIVELEKIVQKMFTVKPVITGTPRSGYHIESITAFPESVSLEGGERVFQEISSLETEPVDISGADSTVEEYVFLNLRTNSIHSRNEKIKVRVNISEDNKVKILQIRPFLKGVVKDGYHITSVTVKPSEVSIEGPPKEVDSVKFIMTEAIILDNLETPFEKEVLLNIENKSLTSKTEKVTVKININVNGDS
ncbi:MAG: hypothetical protein L3V56_04890 [Candidatus Magnetoovum sp. WYHC-5]|nr:hypothetical protein [Candidatus Magnetoovum sp. WYHC-5]